MPSNILEIPHITLLALPSYVKLKNTERDDSSYKTYYLFIEYKDDGGVSGYYYSRNEGYRHFQAYASCEVILRQRMLKLLQGYIDTGMSLAL